MGGRARVAVIGPLIMAACSDGPITSSATDDTATTSTSTSSTNTDGMSLTSLSTSTSTSTSTTAPDETTGQVCPTPESYECDPWAQDECCEGEKCSAWGSHGGGWDAWRCVPTDPRPDAVGEPCALEGDPFSGVDSCEEGAMCWGVDPETNTGACVALCQGDEESCSQDPFSCCPAKTLCTTFATGVLFLCLATCDPLAQDCAGDLACYPVGVAFQCATDLSGDMGAVGDPCETINVCDPGTYCGDPAAYPGCDLNAPGCCIPFCPLDAPECVPGTECLPWYDPMDVPSGYENVGACTIPP